MAHVFDVESIKGAGLFKLIGERVKPYTRFALLVGSHAEGLATCASDLDVLLVVADSGFEQVFRESPGSFFIDGFRLDVLFMRSSQVDDLLERSRSAIRYFHPRDAELLHKLVCGVALVGEADRRDRVGELDPAKLSIGLRDRHLRVANDEYANLTGFVTERRKLGAADALRSYARSHIDAYLAARGDAYPPPKWRMCKLERTLTPQHPLFSEIMELEFNVPYDDESRLQQWMASSMNTVRKLQLAIFFGEPAAQWLEADSARRAPRKPAAEAFVTIEALNDAFIVRNLSHQMAVAPPLALSALAAAWPLTCASLAGLFDATDVRRGATDQFASQCLALLEKHKILNVAGTG